MPAVGTLEELRRAIDGTDVDELALDAEPSALDVVADGYHRIAAARRLGREWIEIELRRGTDTRR
jgi:hypothetical protein